MLAILPIVFIIGSIIGLAVLLGRRALSVLAVLTLVTVGCVALLPVVASPEMWVFKPEPFLYPPGYEYSWGEYLVNLTIWGILIFSVASVIATIAALLSRIARGSGRTSTVTTILAGSLTAILATVWIVVS